MEIDIISHAEGAWQDEGCGTGGRTTAESAGEFKKVYEVIYSGARSRPVTLSYSNFCSAFVAVRVLLALCINIPFTHVSATGSYYEAKPVRVRIGRRCCINPKPNLLECVMVGAAVPTAAPCRNSPQPLWCHRDSPHAHLFMPSVAFRRDYSANHPYRQQQLRLHTAAVPGVFTQNRRAGAETRPAEEGKPESPGKRAQSQGTRSRCRWIPKRKLLALEEGGACCTGPAGRTLFYSCGRQIYERNVPRSGVRLPCRIPHSSSSTHV